MAPTRRNDFVSMMSRCCVLAWHSLNELDAPTARRRMLAATSGEPCTRGQGRPARAEQTADGVRRQCSRNPRRLHSPRPRTPTRMLRSMRRRRPTRTAVQAQPSPEPTYADVTLREAATLDAAPEAVRGWRM